MTVTAHRNASPTLTENDARDVVRAITAAENLPEPQFVTLGSSGITIQVADRDAVDEWTEMLEASAVRSGDLYGAGWLKAITYPGVPVKLTVFCRVAPIKWQPRTSVMTA